MRDKRTPKDVCGEAIYRPEPKKGFGRSLPGRIVHYGKQLPPGNLLGDWKQLGQRPDHNISQHSILSQ